MCPVPCRFESFHAHSAIPLNLVPTPHAFQPFQLQTLPFLHLPFPCPNNFSPTFLHCSLSFYWLLKKQTPTLSMSVTQFKAAEGLRGEDMSGDVWRVCKRGREWRAWEKSDKTKCHWSLAFLISFFRAIHFLRKPAVSDTLCEWLDLLCNQGSDLWKERLAAEHLGKGFTEWDISEMSFTVRCECVSTRPGTCFSQTSKQQIKQKEHHVL